MSVFDHWRTHATNGDRSASPPNGHSGADGSVEPQQRYRRLVDAAEANPDAFMVMRPVRDAGGSIIDFAIEFQNRAAHAMHRSHGGIEEVASLSSMVGKAGGGLARMLEPYVAALTSGIQHEDQVATLAMGQDRWYARRLVPVGDAIVVTYRETTDQVLELEALARAGADKQAILDGLADLVLVADLAGDGQFRISYANQPYYAFFGLTPEQVIGKTGDELYDGELRDTIRSASLAAADRPVTVELSGPVQGQPRHVQVRITPVLDASGQVVRRIWRGTDLTDQHQVQVTLERSQSHYEAILNGLSDLICVSEPAEDGEFRITYANPAYLQFMGVDAEDITNRPRDRFQRADLYDLYDSIRREAIALGGPLSRDLSAEINGRMRHAHVLVTPEFDDQGNCIRAIWRVTDLTGQRESEAELDRAEALEQAILDGLSDFVYVLDRDERGEFRFKHANRAAYDAGEPRDLLGKRIEDILDPEQASSRMELLLRCVRQREPVSGEFTAYVGGRQMIVDVRATPVMDEDHEVHRVIWRATDLTERRASENLFRAAATANLDPFNHLEPVYGPHGEVADFIFRYGNAAGLEFRRHFSGRDDVDRLSQLFERVPRALQGEMDLYLRAMRGGRALEDEVRAVDIQGNVRWIYRQIIPVEGGVLVSGRDITERKLQDQAMERAERIQRMILEGLNDAIVLSEQDDEGQWRVLYANRAFLDSRGLDAEQVVGKTAWDYLPREVAERNEELRAEALEAGGPTEREVATTVDGVEQWRMIRVTPVLDDEGRCIRAIWRITDVTQERAAETRFSAAAEANLDAFMMFEPIRDPGGDIVDFTLSFANGAARKGGRVYSGGREVQRLSDMFVLAPDGFAHVRDQYVDVVTSGQPRQDEVASDAGGRERWYQRQLVPLRGGLIVTYRDVTKAKQAQLTIEGAERNLRAILNGLADAVVVSDRNANGDFPITYANPAFFTLLRIPPDEVVSKGVAAFLPPEIARAVVATRVEAIREGGPIEREIGGTVRGRRLDLAARIMPVFDEAGECTRLIWRLNDVGEARRHQRELEQAEANQRAILDGLHDGILVFERQSAGEDFLVTYSRPIEALRDSYTDIVGSTFEAIWQGERLAERRDVVERAIAGRHPVDFETTIVTSADAVIHELARVTPVFDDQGVCTRLVCRFTDVTEVYEQRRAIEEAERNQRAILDGLSDCIYVLDRDQDGEFRFSYANNAALADRDGAQALGKRIEEVMAPADATTRVALLESAATTGRAQSVELPFSHDGRPEWLSISATPVVSVGGEVHRVIWRVSDVTEVRRQQRRIEESEGFRRAVLESLTDIIVVADRSDDGRFLVTYANAAWDRMAGRGDAGIIGRFLEDYAAENTLQNIRQAIAGGEPRDFAHHMVFGGRERDFAARVTPVFDGDGECIRIILRYADETERYLQQQKIEAAERNQRAILDALSDVLIVMDRDPELRFRVTYINAAREALTGRPDAQLLGKAALEFLSETEAAQLERTFEYAISCRRTVDFEGTTPDRNDEPLFYSARITPVFEEDGTSSRVILRYTDVTAERLARQRLEESERNREAIVENLADIVLLFDRDDAGDFRLSYANPPFFETGRTPEETLDQRFEDFLDPSEASVRKAMLSQALEVGGPVERELTVRVRDRLFHYTSRVTPLFDHAGSGQCHRTIWRYTNITELVNNREQLAESERNQRAIIEGLSDALLVLDRRDDGPWQVAQANAAYFAMVGVTAGESLGRTLAGLAGSSDDARETLAAVEEALAAGAPIDSETERVTGAGSSVIARRVTPLFDGNGRCHRVLVRTTDLTERRMRDAMLNRLGRIIDDATDEVYLVDTGFGLLQTNAGARRNLGYTEGEALNLSVTQVIVGETEESLRGWMAPLLDGSQSRVTIEARLRRKDGSTYPVEAELQYMAGESPPVVLAIARDVTERQALQATLARMAAIVESSADAVIGVDNDGRIEHWNPAAHRLFGHARQEVLGRALSDVFGGGRWPADRLEALARGGGAVDTSLPRRDSDEIDVALSVFPVHDPTGRALGTAMIAHDIRWRLDATRALRESESRFRTIVDQAPSGILIQRASDGIILDINQYLLDLVGYRRDEVVGNRPIELGLIEDPSIVVALDSQLATGTRTAPRELGVLTRSGETKEMLASVESIDLNGERCYLSFLGDISRLRTAERDLLRAQEGLRSITQNLPVILTSWDEHHLCTLATGHGLELAGLEGDALLGHHISEIIGSSHQLETVMATAEPGHTGAIEFSLAGRIFESQYRVLPDGSGTVAVAVDVTEQRATLGQIETIVENAPITLVVVDAEGVITIARGRSEGLSFSLQDGVGRSIFDILPAQSPAHPDLRRALAGERFSATYQSPAATSVDVHYNPVRSADGGLTGVAAVIIDVTERLRAQLAIQQSNERFRQIAETATDGIVSVSTEGRIVFANQALAAIFGYDREALIGRPLTILMPHELASAHRQGFRRYLDTGEKRLSWNGLELTGRRRDGTDFQAEMSFSEGSHDGERVVTAFIRDITERRRSEEAMLQAQKLESLGILAGGIAHDFNNMLVAIMGNAGLAMADLSPESPAYETVQEIELAARRAAELARQMLAYSGKGRLAVSRVDLSSLVLEIPHLLRSSIGVGVNLSYDLASDLPPVEADVTQLRQVIMNLVINASDAIGEHEGVVAVSTGVVEADSAYLSSTFLPGELKPGQYCYLEVADTGSGMSPDTLARIFDPFFTTKFTGKGLGLAAVLGIVRGHRGTIKVQSTPGQGTTFRMLIPVAQDALPSTVVRAPSADAWKGEGLVLVVDDEESVRNVTSRALRSMGLETVLAVDGQDGLERFEALHQQLTCVLMDLTMPRLNGEAAAARMRAIDPSVPIVLMSGFDESEMATRFRTAGIAGFVQKPYEVRSLRGAISLAMARTD